MDDKDVSQVEIIKRLDAMIWLLLHPDPEGKRSDTFCVQKLRRIGFSNSEIAALMDKDAHTIAQLLYQARPKGGGNGKKS